MARKSKNQKKRPTMSRRSRFMRNSAFVLAFLMAGSLIGASYYRKTTGHLTHGNGSKTSQPEKEARPIPYKTAPAS
ncbi:MAG TPA: hypothetical protein VM432_13985 [Bdellovibrionales bacterium]|nr:hypothetical protein [Bdellovibrionales bacterium]